MNLEIHKPELARRVQAQIQSGHFHDADELIEKALPPSLPAPGDPLGRISRRFRFPCCLTPGFRVP